MCSLHAKRGRVAAAAYETCTSCHYAHAYAHMQALAAGISGSSFHQSASGFGDQLLLLNSQGAPPPLPLPIAATYPMHALLHLPAAPHSCRGSGALR